MRQAGTQKECMTSSVVISKAIGTLTGTTRSGLSLIAMSSFRYVYFQPYWKAVMCTRWPLFSAAPVTLPLLRMFQLKNATKATRMNGITVQTTSSQVMPCRLLPSRSSFGRARKRTTATSRTKTTIPKMIPEKRRNASYR